MSLLLMLFSCIKENPTFQFTNNSNIKIDSILVSVSDECKPTKISNILPKQAVSGKIVFCEKTKRDGNYGIRIFSEGKLKKVTGFSYYTNGASGSNNFDIEYTNQNNFIITEN